MKTKYYMMANGNLYTILARDANDAKIVYRNVMNVKKIPPGSVISKDRNCQFFKNAPFMGTLQGDFK